MQLATAVPAHMAGIGFSVKSEGIIVRQFKSNTVLKRDFRDTEAFELYERAGYKYTLTGAHNALKRPIATASRDDSCEPILNQPLAR